MRRLLTAGALAVPVAVSLLAAPAAQAGTFAIPRPTPSTYAVQRSFAFEGGDPARRIAISCERGDEIVARRATVTPLRTRDFNRDRARRAVVRLIDLRVSRDRQRLSATAEPTGRDGRARVTLRVLCREDRGRGHGRHGGFDQRGDQPTATPFGDGGGRDGRGGRSTRDQVAPR